MSDKKMYLVGGNHGTGKSIFIEKMLEGKAPVITAANEVSNKAITDGESFILESTLNTHVTSNIVDKAKENGYEVHFVYLGVSSPQVSRERVLSAVADGADDVSIETITATEQRSLDNAEKILQKADFAAFYDTNKLPELIFLENEETRFEYKANYPEWAKRYSATQKTVQLVPSTPAEREEVKMENQAPEWDDLSPEEQEEIIKEEREQLAIEIENAKGEDALEEASERYKMEAGIELAETQGISKAKETLKQDTFNALVEGDYQKFKFLMDLPEVEEMIDGFTPEETTLQEYHKLKYVHQMANDLDRDHELPDGALEATRDLMLMGVSQKDMNDMLLHIEENYFVEWAKEAYESELMFKSMKDGFIDETKNIIELKNIHERLDALEISEDEIYELSKIAQFPSVKENDEFLDRALQNKKFAGISPENAEVQSSLTNSQGVNHMSDKAIAKETNLDNHKAQQAYFADKSIIDEVKGDMLKKIYRQFAAIDESELIPDRYGFDIFNKLKNVSPSSIERSLFRENLSNIDFSNQQEIIDYLESYILDKTIQELASGERLSNYEEPIEQCVNSYDSIHNIFGIYEKDIEAYLSKDFVEEVRDKIHDIGYTKKDIDKFLEEFAEKSANIEVQSSLTNSKGVNQMSDKAIAKEANLDNLIKDVQQHEILVSYDASYNKMSREANELNKTVHDATDKMEVMKAQMEKSLGLIYKNPEDASAKILEASQNKEGNLVYTRYANNISELLEKPEKFGEVKTGAKSAIEMIKTQGLGVDMVEASQKRAEAGELRGKTNFKMTKQSERSFEKAKEWGLAKEFGQLIRQKHDKGRLETPLVQNYLKVHKELSQALETTDMKEVDAALKIASERVGKEVKLDKLKELHPQVKHMQDFVAQKEKSKEQAQTQTQTKKKQQKVS